MTLERRALDPSIHRGAMLLAIAAFLALALTLWRYFHPLSGVTGTTGALLAAFGCAMLVLAALLLIRLDLGAVRTVVMTLCWIGAILTLVAQVLLHGWIAVGLLAVCVFALLIESIAPTRRLRMSR